MYPLELNGNQHELENKPVRFRISDAYVPLPSEILAKLHGQDLLQGRVVGCSNHGAGEEAFAVVEVARISQQVVVPLNKIVLLEK